MKKPKLTYKVVKKEKMKGVHLIPKLRFHEFHDPWIEKTLSELLSFKNGLNASKEDYGRGYKFINVLDIINNDYITYDKILGSVNVPESEFQKNIVEYGDILFQRSSETREEVGQSNVYLDKERPATFGGFVIRGKKIGEYDPIFLNKLLSTSKARKLITDKSGGSTRYNVGQDTLSSVRLLTTILPEQQKIATFLTSVDKRITLLTQKKEKLEQYKKGVMQKLFSVKTDGRPSLRFKDENGREFPEWEEKKLGEISQIIMGQSPDSKFYNTIGNGLPLIQGNADIKNRFSNPRQWTSEKTKTCNIGDLLLTVRAPVGAIAKSKHQACIGRGVCAIKKNEYSENEFIYPKLRVRKF
jgi:type I restriction enzyme, S subunit